MSDYKDLILSHFLCEWPEDWTYETTINRLKSEDFYTHDDLNIFDPYANWNTKFLATEVEGIVQSVGRYMDQKAMLK